MAKAAPSSQLSLFDTTALTSFSLDGGGFGSLLPPNPVSALAVSAAEREAVFEERWRVGGFALLGTYMFFAACITGAM